MITFHEASAIRQPRQLQAGEALRMPLDAGDALHITQGSARLTAPPRWLGETMFSTEVTLGEGAVHVVEQGGWIELLALSPLRVEWIAARAMQRSRQQQPHQAQPVRDSRVARLFQLLAGR